MAYDGGLLRQTLDRLKTREQEQGTFMKGYNSPEAYNRWAYSLTKLGPKPPFVQAIEHQMGGKEFHMGTTMGGYGPEFANQAQNFLYGNTQFRDGGTVNAGSGFGFSNDKMDQMNTRRREMIDQLMSTPVSSSREHEILRGELEDLDRERASYGGGY